jgi:DNA-binding ferritin-like protein (Dps family)
MKTEAKILNQENNELDKRLTEENNVVMTDMVCYLRLANISEHDQEVVRHDLLQMVLSAQERGEDIKTLIGEDYKSFCDEVIAALPQKSQKERVIDLIDILLLSTSILGGIHIVLSKETMELIYNAVTGQQLNFQISISVGNLLSYVIIIATAFLIIHVIGKNLLKPEEKHNQSKLKRFIIAGAIGGGLMAVFLIIAWVGRQILFTVNVFAACVFIIGLYIAHKLLQKFVIT